MTTFLKRHVFTLFLGLVIFLLGLGGGADDFRDVVTKAGNAYFIIYLWMFLALLGLMLMFYPILYLYKHYKYKHVVQKQTN